MQNKPYQSNSSILLQLDLLNLDLNEVKDYINQIKNLPHTIIPEVSKSFLLNDLEKLYSGITENIRIIYDTYDVNSINENNKIEDEE